MILSFGKTCKNLTFSLLEWESYRAYISCKNYGLNSYFDLNLFINGMSDQSMIRVLQDYSKQKNKVFQFSIH